ncbi:MAG: hypothetical protein M3N56_01295 [Actinomycetota bacterium]|nr:hypothetical protein [Actinomycetota bacterium]
MPYSFRIDPAAALTSRPGAPIKGTAEPNDTRSTAGGPLVPGAWYYSTLETVNDEDWLRFYVRPGLQSSCVRSATVVRVAPDDAIMSAAEVKRACGAS